MVKLLLQWLRDRWAERRTVDCRQRFLEDRGDLFRADAKAEEAEGRQLAVIGGRYCADERTTWEAPWYSVVVTPESCPWAFAPKGPQRRIASLELLATLVCVVYFLPGVPRHEMGVLRLSGGTDNQGNGFLLDKLMTSKFPLNVVLMELAVQLEMRRLRLDLGWIRRELNTKADALTNEDFTGLDPAKRIHVDLTAAPFPVFHRYMAAGQDLYGRLEEAKAEAATRENGSSRRRRKRESLRTRDPW
jgi:hypothetical protein